VSPSTALVRKLIAVLESIEKLPVYSYDCPGAGYGLQVGADVLYVVESDSLAQRQLYLITILNVSFRIISFVCTSIFCYFLLLLLTYL